MVLIWVFGKILVEDINFLKLKYRVLLKEIKNIFFVYLLS